MNPANSHSFLVHVSSTESREIHAFRLDSLTGSLVSIEALTVPGTGAPTRGNIPLAWSPDRKTLHAQIRTDPFPLSSYSVDPVNGKLQLAQSVDMPSPLAYLAITRDGKYLLGASYDHAQLTVNPVEADGRVSVPCLQTIPTPPKAHCVIEASFGAYVYATSVTGECILLYRLDRASGRLDALAEISTRPGSGPRHLVFHPSLDRLYCINEHAGSLCVYSVDRTSGKLEELQYESIVPRDFSGNAMASDLHLTPNGRLVYASVRKTHSIVMFRVDPTTGLISEKCTFEVEANPRGFAIEPDGRYLLCAGQDSNHLAVYAIDHATGALSLMDRYPVGKRPSWIEIVPTPAEML